MPDFHSYQRLVQRLTVHLNNPTKNITLLLGSGATQPDVPGVNGILDLAEQYVTSQIQIGSTVAPGSLNISGELQDARTRAASPWEAYTKYYETLEGIAGRPAFDVVIQHAVRTAYLTPRGSDLEHFLQSSPWGRLDHHGPSMERDSQSWRLPSGIESLGRLLIKYSSAFGSRVLTTNFDPLIEVSIDKNGGHHSIQSYKTDGSFDTFVGESSQINVIHLHGYWRSNPGEHRSLLHSPTDLRAPRNTLLSNLADLIRETLVVVVGYGAWDDVFTGALSNLRTARECDVLWAFYSDEESRLTSASESLLNKIGDSHSIVFYKGVDSNRLFPELLANIENGIGQPPRTQTQQARKPASKVDVAVPYILPIGDRGVTSELYGPKAATLSRLKRNEINVPGGFCIDLTRHSVEEMQRNGDLRTIWDELKGGQLRTDANPIMVRSSASVEDSPTALFPGRFASRKDVVTLTDLIVGVSTCAASTESSAVTEYQIALGIDPGKIRMAAIVQRQVTAKLAGVAFTQAPPPYGEYEFLVEMTEGPADQLLVGEVTGSLYSVARMGDHEDYVHLCGPDIETSVITQVLAKLSSACQSISGLLEAPQDIEWVWDGRELYIVQARPIRTPSVDEGEPVASTSHQAERSLPSLPLAGTWGLKAAAAQYFAQHGWGAANALVVPPYTDPSDVFNILQSYRPGERGTVIRFSVGTNVGVAKRFVAPGGNVVRAFLETRNSDSWAGIVSDYVFVDGSFEAYVANRALLVEHVPGNWEPDNQLAPDVFLWTEGRYEYLRVSSPRDAAVEVPSGRNAPGVLRKLVRPLTDEVATSWAERMIERFSVIRADMAADLPVNVHFVSDKSDNWYFLNIRPTTNLDMERSDRLRGDIFKANRLFLVVGPDDVDHWDRQSRILINCAADRGGLRRISSLARSLRDAGVTEVFCTFGVLSHPAILLREFGLRVVPLYLDHEMRDIVSPRW